MLPQSLRLSRSGLLFFSLSILVPLPTLLRPHMSHSNFLSPSTAERRRQTTPESRLTDSCCQGTSISRMCIGVRKSERTHVYTGTNTTAQRWRLPWVISRVSRGVRQLSLQPGKRKHVDIYLFHSSVFRFPLRTCLSNFKRATLTFYQEVIVHVFNFEQLVQFLTRPLWSGLWALPKIKMIISGRKCGTQKGGACLM